MAAAYFNYMKASWKAAVVERATASVPLGENQGGTKNCRKLLGRRSRVAGAAHFGKFLLRLQLQTNSGFYSYSYSSSSPSSS